MIRHLHQPAETERSSVAAVIAHSLYQPSREDRTPSSDPHQPARPQVFVWREDGKVVGVIAVRGEGERGEISHIAVDPAYRIRGIGRAMIYSLPTVCGFTEVWAETDQDAVDFYRRSGFAVESLGWPYPNTERFRCRLALPGAVAAPATRDEVRLVGELIAWHQREAGMNPDLWERGPAPAWLNEFPWDDQWAWVLVGYTAGRPVGYGVICRLPKLDVRRGFL
ncbi:MAG: GNAT family N-acetyltransferase [Bacillota bacterium]